MTSCSVASLLAAKRSSTDRKSENSSVAMLRAKLSLPSACASATVSKGSHCEFSSCLSPDLASCAATHELWWSSLLLRGCVGKFEVVNLARGTINRGRCIAAGAGAKDTMPASHRHVMGDTP